MQLKFTLQGQRLIRTDRLSPVADSKNFLGAEFEFSHQWGGCEKTAIFKDADGMAYSVLLNEDKCAIPYEVMGGEFCVSVFGIKDEMRITSDEISVFVEASGFAEGETPQEPTQSVYEQILNRVSDSESAISDEIDTSVQTLSAQMQSIDEKLSEEVQSVDNKLSAEIQSINDKISQEVQTIDNKLSTQIQESEGRFSDGLENLKNQLTQSIDNHKEAFDIHISADERALWNTVSEKAEQSDLEALQTQANNNSDNIAENQRHITELYNQVDARVHYEEFEELQTQMGKVEETLDGIISIQNTLMGGDAV